MGTGLQIGAVLWLRTVSGAQTQLAAGTAAH